MPEEIYCLQALLKDLPRNLGVPGKMAAYEYLAEKCGKSVSVVRRWFAQPDTQFYQKPPMEKQVWDALEEASGKKLKRVIYYPMPDFWDES